MLATNPFAELSQLVPPSVMQWYVIVMILLVAGGTLYDIVHKGSATYFFNNWRKSQKTGREIAGNELASLAMRTAVEDVLVQGGGLLALSYSRSAEAEADRRSVELMAKAGYEPAAIARFFALLEEKLGDKSNSNIFSTHPGTPQRRKEITDYARILSGQSDPDLQ